MPSQMGAVASLSDSLERFDRETIMARSKESIREMLVDIFGALECIEHYELLEVTVDEDESRVRPGRLVGIEESRLLEVTVRFRVSFRGEVEEVERRFFIPKIVEDFFLMVNGVRYFPILQIGDRDVFVSQRSYNLKTLRCRSGSSTGRPP